MACDCLPIGLGVGCLSVAIRDGFCLFCACQNSLGC
jgi:hypothetical protein